MIELTPDEARVLGVLIEKELTTPDQYPLTLNAAVNGSNQKSNREPVVSFDEDRAHDALNGLRQKGLVVRVDQHGSRVPKYRHETMQKLGITRHELVILAELMLRGPQTVGELRARASRMQPLESLDVVKEMLAKLASREMPLARELPPSPGSRAERFMQLLCPTAHPIEAAAAPAESASAETMVSNRTMMDRISALEGEVEAMKAAIRKLAAGLGEAEPFGGSSEV